MGALFSSKKKSNPRMTVTDQDKAILTAKVTRDRLKHICRRCELNIEKDREKVRALLRDGNKSQALWLLKRKRYEEATATKVMDYIEKIEQMIRSLEMAQLNVEVTERLRQGNEALKTINESISIEEVERIIEESREAESFQEELAVLLRGKLSEEDEQAAEHEYEQLLAEQLPTAITEKPTAKPVEEEVEKRLKEKEHRQHSKPIALQAS